MKNFLLAGLISFSSLGMLFAQAGNSCNNPYLLTVSDSACNFDYADEEEVGNNLDSIFPSFFNNQKIKPKKISWHKFTATSENIGFQIAEATNYNLVFYSGTCGNFSPIAAFSSYIPPFNGYLGVPISKEKMLGAVQNLVVGNQYWVQISVASYVFRSDLGICLFKISDQGKKVVSTAIGGEWANKTSWLGSKIPGPLDTAVVADGATISIGTGSDIAIKRLEIGQNSSSIAKILINSIGNRFYIYGDMVIDQGDSLKAKNNLLYGDLFFLYGNLVNNGVISYMNKNQIQPATFNAQFHFRSRLPQLVSGIGKFVAIGIPCLIIDNPAGVKWNIGGYLRSLIYLKRGLFDNTLADLRFDYDSLKTNDGATPGIIVENGSISKKITNPSLRITGFISQNSLIYTEVKDDSLNQNKDIVLNEFVPLRTSFILLTLNKWSGRRILVNRSLKVSSLSLNNGILVGGPLDTLCYGGGGSILSNHGLYSTFGFHRCLIDYNRTINWAMPVRVGGKARSVYLSSSLNQAIGTSFMVRVLNQQPGGTLQAPATFFMGPHVVEIKMTNGSLGADTKLQMEVYKTDIFVGLKTSWRIIQAPSPNGPWSVLDVTSLFVAAGDSILDGRLRTTQAVNLSNGNYFAFASIATSKDAILTRLLPVPIFGLACGSNQSTTVKLLVKNNGIAPLYDIAVGCRLNGSLYSAIYTTGLNGFTELVVGQTDTFQFEIQGLPAGVFPVKYFVSTTSDGNRTNDTIRTSFNNAVLPLPALVNFDTCRYMSLSSSGNGYFYNGYPIVQGWENGLTGREVSSITYGNTFFAMPTNTPTNPTKFHLVSYLFFPNKLGRLRTYSFGPTSSNTWLSYNFNFADYIQPATQMLVGDTISIEASDDCGLSYKVLRSIHRNNFLPYVKVMSDLGAPTSLWRDSVPFPEGSIVHFQIRVRSNQAILNSSEIRFDNLWVKDSITTSISKRPIIQNEMYVYPNPAASEIFVQGPEGEQLSQVFYTDIAGRRSRLEMDSENRIGIKALPTGVYILEAKGKKGMYKKRFVKD